MTPGGLSDRLRGLLPPGARQAGVVFSGDVISKTLTFLLTPAFLVLLAPEEYRLYGLFITVLAAVNSLTDLGLHRSFIRFFSLYRDDAPARAETFVRLSIRIKLLLTVACAVLLWVLAGPVSGALLKAPALEPALRLLAFGVLGASMVEFFLAYLQGQQRFRLYAVLRLFEGAGKTVVIFAAVLLGAFSLQLVFDAYVYTAVALALAGALVLRLGRTGAALPLREVQGEMWDFGKWMVVTSLAEAFITRLDVFMVSALLPDAPAEAGLYIAATRLVLPLLIMGASVLTVLYPKAMALRSLEEMRRYVRVALRLALPLLAVAVLYLVAVLLATPRFFPNYTPFLPVFTVLWIGQLWYIVGSPFAMIVLSLNRSRFYAAVALAQLAVLAVSHYFFIGWLGGMGAAVSVALVTFGFGALNVIYAYRNRTAIEFLGGSDAS